MGAFKKNNHKEVNNTPRGKQNCRVQLFYRDVNCMHFAIHREVNITLLHTFLLQRSEQNSAGSIFALQKGEQNSAGSTVFTERRT